MSDTDQYSISRYCDYSNLTGNPHRKSGIEVTAGRRSPVALDVPPLYQKGQNKNFGVNSYGYMQGLPWRNPARSKAGPRYSAGLESCPGVWPVQRLKARLKAQ